MHGEFLLLAGRSLLGGCGAPEPVSPFPVFPDDQNGRGIEDGRIRATENTYQQDDHKMPDAFPAEKNQGEQCEHDR